MRKTINNRTVFTRCDNANHHEIHYKIVNHILTAEVAEAQGFGPVREAYAAAFEQESAVYQRILKFEETAIIRQDDDARDRTLQFTVQTVETAALSPIPAVRQAGEELRYVTDAFREAWKRDYAANTSEVRKFLAQIRSEKYAASVEALHLTETLALLEEQNEAVAALLSERSAVNRERVEGANMRSARHTLDGRARDMFDVMEAKLTLNHFLTHDATVEAALSPLMDSINAELLWLKRVLAAKGISFGSSDDGTENEDADFETGEESSDGTDSGTGSGSDGGTSSGEEPGNGEDTGTGSEGTGTPDSGDTEGGTTPPPTTGGNDDDEEVVG